jgi:two-component system response regulator YesN
VASEFYSFIIVDDEPEIREGIRDNIPWEDFGFRFAGACANGNEALELIERDAPDVVMTDINMPFMDGLTLSERIKAVAPATKVLILTGYDDFEYARKALQLQVHDFILKPVTPSEFKSGLARLKEALDQERGARRDIDRLKRQLAESLPLLRERFLNRLVSGRSDGAAERIAYFGLPIPDEGVSYHVSLLDFDERSGGEAFDLDIIAERNLIEEALGERPAAAVFLDEEDRLAVLSWGKDADQLYREGLKTAESLRMRLQRAGFSAVSIGVGETAAGLDKLEGSYRDALRALEHAQIRGGGAVTAYRELAGVRGAGRTAARRWGKQLAAEVRTASLESALRVVDEMTGHFRRPSFGSSVEEYRRALRDALAALVQVTEDLEVPERDAFPGDEDPFILLRELKTPDLARQWFAAAVTRIVACLGDRQENFAETKAREAAAYIEERYSDPDLSLPVLCKDLYISTSYFSAIFKKYKERTFVEHLTEVRIEKAKELLRTTNLKTYEVAERVGYRDAHYFSLSFRKIAGATPTSYRNGREDEET